jgi:hypothetical protein
MGRMADADGPAFVARATTGSEIFRFGYAKAVNDKKVPDRFDA